MKRAPKTLPELIAWTGEGLYGPAYKRKLAAGLGISRSTLRLWMLGFVSNTRDMESELLLLIDRERVATSGRGVDLTALRNALIASSKKERSDVAA